MAHVEKRITEAWCPVCDQRMVKVTEDTHICLMHPDAPEPAETEPAPKKKAAKKKR